MSLFIGYRTAYEFWLTNDSPSAKAPLRVRLPQGTRVKGSDVAKLDLSRFGISGRPLHTVVADANDRCQTKGSVCHVWKGPVPVGSFVRLDNGLFISSPARTFVEMAGELSLVELVRFGYILCGTYAYDKNSEEGFRKRPAPLATVQTLKSHVEKMGGRPGTKKAVRALRFIAEASASPMETNLAMSLCLPRMIGGYGLDMPELNFRIDARSKGLVERDHFVCDLYWKKSRTCAEYDSGAHHSGEEAEARDSARRSALLSEGVTVVSVTPSQFFDARKFDETARAIAKLICKRLPDNNASWMMRRYELRAELLKDPLPD